MGIVLEIKRKEFLNNESKGEKIGDRLYLAPQKGQFNTKNTLG